MIDDNTLYTMTYTLNSGIKGTVNLSSVQINVWIESFKIGSKFIIEIGNEYFGLNPNCVADFKVHNMFSEQRRQIEAIQHKNAQDNEHLKEAYGSKQVVARVECNKCGTQYTTELIYKMHQTICTKCKSKVYLKENLGMLSTNKGLAFYYTNDREE